MHNLGVTIYEGYGLTESSGSSTTNPHDAPRFGSVGKPIRGTRIAIDPLDTRTSSATARARSSCTARA